MHITTTCPVRISLIGGSSDLDAYLDKHGKGSVISFTPNLNTYVYIYKDVLGRNNLDNKYIINYSQREEVSQVSNIKNHLVKAFFEEYNIPPCSVHMTSDVFSYGSGLATSSSYACGLALAIAKMQNTNVDVRIAHSIEKKINPLLGMQDIFGCCVGGFKKIEFEKDKPPKYTFLSTALFDSFDTYLYFTGYTRNSTEILQTIHIPDKDIFNPLVEKAEKYIVSNNFYKFMQIIKQGWEEKKLTSKKILGNSKLISLDEWIQSLPGCIAHKLCGAGNGGFFLAFFDKGTTVPANFHRIFLSNTGLRTIINIPQDKITGIVAGAFDIIHPGYCRLFKECKNYCNHLTVAIHDDPSIENNKLKPVHTLEERKEILSSITHIDEIVHYHFESDLENILASGNFDKRFLGSDYKGREYTGKHLNIPIVWISRDHAYSTTKLKKMISDSLIT